MHKEGSEGGDEKCSAWEYLDTGLQGEGEELGVAHGPNFATGVQGIGKSRGDSNVDDLNCQGQNTLDEYQIETLVEKAMRSGVKRFDLSPRPSCPLRFSPQTYTYNGISEEGDLRWCVCANLAALCDGEGLVHSHTNLGDQGGKLNVLRKLEEVNGCTGEDHRRTLLFLASAPTPSSPPSFLPLVQTDPSSER